ARLGHTEPPLEGRLELLDLAGHRHRGLDHSESDADDSARSPSRIAFAVSPARMTGRSGGTTSSAFARAIDVSRPEPCGPVRRAHGTPSSHVTTTRMKCVSGAPIATSSWTRTAIVRGNTSRSPRRRRITGRAKISKVTIAETGLPGNPSQG